MSDSRPNHAALDRLHRAASDATIAARTAGVKVVFAESCTAGLVSAGLAQIPGASDFHCGSAVTYREQTKIEWLDLDENDLNLCSAVSSLITREMAVQVLKKTPEADWACAITGHFGPAAPADQNGLVFIAIARRSAKMNDIHVNESSHQLKSNDRVNRQYESAALVLEQWAKTLVQTQRK